jgi:hypothetical protein
MIPVDPVHHHHQTIRFVQVPIVKYHGLRHFSLAQVEQHNAGLFCTARGDGAGSRTPAVRSCSAMCEGEGIYLVGD